jgi:3-oxoacyl-[acyl-carrier protein] reductase
MDLGLQGRVAVVCGAGKGLGYAAALELAREGANVVICARDKKVIAAAAEKIAGQTGFGALGIAADVSESGSAEKVIGVAVESFGGVDILVNNAGGPPAGSFDHHDDQAWSRAAELNLMSAVRFSRTAIPHMRRKRWGRIINITSVAVKQPVEGLILSNAVRAAVVGMAKTLSNELAGDGILVNNVCPGFIETDRSVSLVRGRAEQEGTTYEEQLAKLSSTIPLGRMGQPSELAALIAFLASERAGYVTGATIQVDGGLMRAIM